MANIADAQGSSTRPYLIRALHDWCTDNGLTPYIAVQVGPGVQVPVEYVKNGEIVLNVGFEATSGMRLGNDFIEFKARFGGSSRDIVVPVDHVVAIYARENGQGMAFPAPSATAAALPVPGTSSTPLAGSGGGGLRLASTETPQQPDTTGSDAAQKPTASRPVPTMVASDDDEPPPPPPSPPPPTPGAPGPARGLRRVK
jgi:stringent starvation protein B